MTNAVFIRNPFAITLSPDTAQWLASLSPELAPRQTARSFPHVVNSIASLWKSPRRLDGYFEDLLVDHRGNRQGFPFAVAHEIARLREHYQLSVFPIKKSCVWEGIS